MRKDSREMNWRARGLVDPGLAPFLIALTVE